MRLKCLAQEHNTMSLAGSQTQTARSGVERTNHEATAPLNGAINQFCHIILLIMVIIKKKLGANHLVQYCSKTSHSFSTSENQAFYHFVFNLHSC